MLFCLRSKEIILYSYFPVGTFEKRHCSATMLLLNKATWGLIGGRLISKNDFLGGGLLGVGGVFEEYYKNLGI